MHSDQQALVVVAWHNERQIAEFLKRWKITMDDPRVVFSRDPGWKSCALTKNAGIERALERKPEFIIVLDDDCMPEGIVTGPNPLGDFIMGHLIELTEEQDVEIFSTVTNPRSRGTPHLAENRCLKMKVAASMGFWSSVGDYDAPSQLAYGATHPMQFERGLLFGSPFAMSGMNVAFRADLWPYFKFINVSRYDDIWSGWILQKYAYSLGYCISTCGPTVEHSRQSNVWQNLLDEAKYAEANETLWRKIWQHPNCNYEELVGLLPVK
jgi:hypothetical protein